MTNKRSPLVHKVCPLCGSAFSLLYNLPHSKIVKCEQDFCGFVFAETQPSDGDLQKIYNTIYYLEGDTDTEKAEKPNSDALKFEQHFAFLLNRFDLSTARIMDYGCGIGNFLEVVQRAGIAAPVGVELNDRARAHAREKGFRVEKSIEAHEGKSIDVVYMNDVIEHLRDPVEELGKIRRVLTQGGALFVVTMDINGLKARLLKDRWALITDPTHFYFYTAKTLKSTLLQAGFSLVSEEIFYVRFGHHNIPRQAIQFLLAKTGLDTGLKMLAYR